MLALTAVAAPGLFHLRLRTDGKALVPQHDPYDITSGRFAMIEGGEVIFRHRIIREVLRSELDAQADRIRARVDDR